VAISLDDYRWRADSHTVIGDGLGHDGIRADDGVPSHVGAYDAYIFAYPCSGADFHFGPLQHRLVHNRNGWIGKSMRIVGNVDLVRDQGPLPDSNLTGGVNMGEVPYHGTALDSERAIPRTRERDRRKPSHPPNQNMISDRYVLRHFQPQGRFEASAVPKGQEKPSVSNG
jgi:hypothetical protein